MQKYSRRTYLAVLFLAILCFSAIPKGGQAAEIQTAKSQYTCNDCEIDVKQNEGFFELLIHDPVAFFTAVLASLTFVLAGVSTAQIYYLKQADKTSRVAAEATAASAKAVISLERPRLIMAKTFISQDSESTAYVDYAVENIGKSPAIMRSSSVEIRCVPELPSEPDYQRVIPTRRVFYHRETVDEFRATMLRSDEANLRDHFDIFVFGFFEYEDVFGATITSGFGYRSDRLNGKLLRAGGTAYNYDRREEKG